MFWIPLRRSTSILFVVVAASLGGCGVGGSGDAPAEQSGTTTLALLATGADGATYNFPSGSQIQFQSGIFSTGLLLDRDESSVSARLPVGSYDIFFLPSTPTQLVRTLNGVATLVSAELLNPSPLTISIAADQITPLPLHFRVNGLSPVSFDLGRVDVTADVARNNVAVAALARVGGTMTPSSLVFGFTVGQDAQDLLTVDLDVPVTSGLEITTTGPWFILSESNVCLPGRLSVIGYPDTPPPGFAARLLEEFGGAVRICLLDFGPGLPNSVSVEVVGRTTPPDQQAALPGRYQFLFDVGGRLPSRIFDGQHLDQGALEAPLFLTSSSFAHTVTNLDTGELITRLNGDFSGTFQLVP